MNTATTTHIVFALYPGVTHLDFCGPHQVFARLPGAQLSVASEGGQNIEAEGLVFTSLEDLTTIAHCDVLCVPGGFGCVEAMERPKFMAAIRRLAGTADYVTSVCTGSLILAAAGLLKGRRAACHWAWRHMLTEFAVIPDEGRVVNDGNIWTGSGVTAGIDFALALVTQIAGADVAQTIQLALEYAPAPPFDSGRPDLEPETVVNGYWEKLADVLHGREAAIRRVAASRANRASQ